MATRPASGAVIQKFSTHLTERGDNEVLRMRPYQLAAEWGENRRDVLEFFLYATKVGALRLDWELICPNCRVPKSEASTFSQIPSRYHCDLCGINYDTDLERSTELRFSVSADLRVAKDAIFCLGSPVRTPHVASQQFVEAGEDRRITLDMRDGPYKIRSVKYNKECQLKPIVAAGAGERANVDLAYADHGFSSSSAPFTPGPVEFVVRNHTGARRLFVVERIGGDPYAVTAFEVTTMQRFRDLFSGEVLAPGQQIGVRNLCIMFTDLKQSTELYERVGDAKAFSRVQRHFGFITDVVGSNGGAVIKTIGDAVMAVFSTRSAGVTAAVTMQRGLAGFNQINKFDPPLVLKVGLHHGPAIAVNANGAFDYFGRTINIAARVQNVSEGDDMVLTEEAYADPDVAAYLLAAGIDMTPIETHLKGLDEAFTLRRAVLAGARARAPAPSAKARVAG